VTKFRVYGVFTATKFLGEFEADSPEEAEEMAANSDENSACLCHYCSDQIELDDNCATNFVIEEDNGDPHAK
jgi:hypothetical protein